MRTRYARTDDEGASDDEDWHIGYVEDVDERQAELLRRLDCKTSGPVKLINPWVTPTGGSARPPMVPTCMFDTDFDLGASDQHNREDCSEGCFSRKPGAGGAEGMASLFERRVGGAQAAKDVEGGNREALREGSVAASAAAQVVMDQLLRDLQRSTSRPSTIPSSKMPPGTLHTRTSHPNHAQQQPTSLSHEEAHANGFAFILHPPQPTQPPLVDPPNQLQSAPPAPPISASHPTTTGSRLATPATRPSLSSPPKRPWILTAGAAAGRSPSGGKISKKKKHSFGIREGPSPSGLALGPPLPVSVRFNTAAAGARSGSPWHVPQGPSPCAPSRRPAGEAEVGPSAMGPAAPAMQGGRGHMSAASPVPTSGGGGGGSKLSALLGPRLPPSAAKQRTPIGPLRTISATGTLRKLRSNTPASQAPPPNPASAAAPSALTSPPPRPAFTTPVRSSAPPCTPPAALVTPVPPPAAGGQEAPVHAGTHPTSTTTPAEGSCIPAPGSGPPGGTGTRQEAGFRAAGSSQKMLPIHSQHRNVCHHQEQQQQQQVQEHHQALLMLPATSTFSTPPPAPRLRVAHGSCGGSVDRPSSAPATLAALLGPRPPHSTPAGTHLTPCHSTAAATPAATTSTAMAPAGGEAAAEHAPGLQVSFTTPQHHQHHPHPHHPSTTPAQQQPQPHPLSGCPSESHHPQEQQQQHPSAWPHAQPNSRQWQQRQQGTPLELMGQAASRQRAFLQGLGPLAPPPVAPLGGPGRRGAGGGGGRRSVGGLQRRLQAVLANLKLLQDRECVAVTSGKPLPPPPAGSLLVEVHSRAREAHLTQATCTVQKVYETAGLAGDASPSAAARDDALAISGGGAAVLPGASVHVFLDSKRNDWGIESGSRFLVLPPYKILHPTAKDMNPNPGEGAVMGEVEGRLATAGGGFGASQAVAAGVAGFTAGAGGGAPAAQSARVAMADGEGAGRTDCPMVLLAHMTRRIDDGVT